MLPTRSATASAAPTARGTWWRASESTRGLSAKLRSSPRTIGMRTDCACCSAMMPASAAMTVSAALRTSTGMLMTSGSRFGSSDVAFSSPAFFSPSGVTGSSMPAAIEHESCPRPACHARHRFRLRAARRPDRADRAATRPIAPAGARTGVRRRVAPDDCRSAVLTAARRSARRQQHARLRRAAPGSSGS